MKRFDITRLKEGDALEGRNLISAKGKAIRDILGSTFNHTVTIINHNKHGWGIGEMAPPCAKFHSFDWYEQAVERGEYYIRIVRIVDASDAERREMSLRWETEIEGMHYSEIGVRRLWVMRFVNSLPWHIHGGWCTRAYGILCAFVFPPERNIFRKIFVEGTPLKKNETPRTIENRLAQGLLVDVTDEVFHA